MLGGSLVAPWGPGPSIRSGPLGHSAPRRRPPAPAVTAEEAQVTERDVERPVHESGHRDGVGEPLLARFEQHAPRDQRLAVLLRWLSFLRPGRGPAEASPAPAFQIPLQKLDELDDVFLLAVGGSEAIASTRTSCRFASGASPSRSSTSIQPRSRRPSSNASSTREGSRSISRTSGLRSTSRQSRSAALATRSNRSLKINRLRHKILAAPALATRALQVMRSRCPVIVAINASEERGSDLGQNPH